MIGVLFRFDLIGSLVSSLPPCLSGALLGMSWEGMAGLENIFGRKDSASIVRLFFCFGTGFVDSLSKCSTRPLDSVTIKIWILLTGYKRQALKLLQPFFIYDHCVMLFGLAVRREPGAVGVCNHIAHILWMHSVENGEEVWPVRVSVLWVLVLQVLHHVTVFTELGEDVFDTQLIIMRHSDKLAFCYWQQRFLTLEDLTQEVAVDGRNGRHI